MESNFQDYVKSGKVTFEVLVGEDISKSREYLFCGEICHCLILLTFQEPIATTELASRLYGHLDSTTIELENESRTERQSLINVNKMRSVESLSSITSSQVHSNEIHYRTSRIPGELVNDHQIKLLAKVIVDSEVTFTKAILRLKFNVFHERTDDTLYNFLSQKRAGARLIKELLVGEEQENVKANLITEILTSTEVKVPVIRPLEATLSYFKKTDDSVLVNFNFFCTESLKESFTLNDLSISIEDADSHFNNFSSNSPFLITPVAIPVPLKVCPGDVFSSIFEAHLLPSSKETYHKDLSSVKIRTNCLLEIHNRMEASSTGSLPLKLSVNFEYELDMSMAFPLKSPELTLTVSLLQEKIVLNEPFDVKIFVKNCSELERDLVISIPLMNSRNSLQPASKKRHEPDHNQTELFIPPEQIIEKYFSDSEHQSPSFIPLCPDLELGLVAPGKCITQSVKFLPIREGLHCIKRLLITDRLSNQTFDLRQLLELTVTSSANAD